MDSDDALREFRMSFIRVRPDGQPTRLGYPENVGRRSKIGGDPEWIQHDESPDCPNCHEAMIFVGQIDSLDAAPDQFGEDYVSFNEYMFGDCGMIYLFFCFACCHVSTVFQCY
jgi:hypothetical protein